MTELAPVDNYQGSEPETVVFNIARVTAAHSVQTPFFVTSGNSLYRLRFLTCAGFRIAGAGTSRLGLGVFVSGQAGLPWTNSNNNSGFTATVPQDITGSDSFMYTWATETQSAYFSQDSNQGWVAQAGLPLAFIPPLTTFGFAVTDLGGSTSDLTVLDGYMLLEKFPLTAVQTQDSGQEQRVYLLSAAKPGDAGSFA